MIDIDSFYISTGKCVGYSLTLVGVFLAVYYNAVEPIFLVLLGLMIAIIFEYAHILMVTTQTTADDHLSDTSSVSATSATSEAYVIEI